MARSLEEHVKARLLDELGADEGETIFGDYRTTHQRLKKDVFGAIAGVEPNLSDHGELHTDNVLHNARKLIGEDHATHKFSAIDLYCLSMFILFHDVGNLFGREDHHKKVGEVFDWARGKHADLRRERTLVVKAAMAHTGVASDGTGDTLKELNEKDHLYDHPVSLRQLAAIVRFADELAEGPQRTSDFMRTHHRYDLSSELFHEYASITTVHIDRVDGRIRVTYDIDITRCADEEEEARYDRVRSLLDFTYRRIIKLDQERRYARYYSKVIAPFRMTSIEFNFHEEGRLLPVGLEPLLLDDKVVPGDPEKTVEEHSEAYRLDALLTQLRDPSIRRGSS